MRNIKCCDCEEYRNEWCEKVIDSPYPHIVRDCRFSHEKVIMTAETILTVAKRLIGETEPYGDSNIDHERMKNLDKLIYVVDELLNDVEKVAFCKDRYEGSMRTMGEKAHKSLSNWWLWIEDYLKESGEWKKGDK